MKKIGHSWPELETGERAACKRVGHQLLTQLCEFLKGTIRKSYTTPNNVPIDTTFVYNRVHSHLRVFSSGFPGYNFGFSWLFLVQIVHFSWLKWQISQQIWFQKFRKISKKIKIIIFLIKYNLSCVFITDWFMSTYGARLLQVQFLCTYLCSGDPAFNTLALCVLGVLWILVRV